MNAYYHGIGDATKWSECLGILQIHKIEIV